MNYILTNWHLRFLELVRFGVFQGMSFHVRSGALFVVAAVVVPPAVSAVVVISDDQRVGGNGV